MFAVYIILQLTLSQVELSNVELCDVPSVRTIRLFVRTFCRVLCSILTSMYDVHRFHNIEYSEEAPTSAYVRFNT